MAERDNEPESDAEEAFEQANPAAVALALGGALGVGKGKAGAAPKLAPEAAAFLKKQSRLIDLQTEHLHEQRTLQLAHLKVRRWHDRLSVALQSLGVALGVVVAIVLVAVAWNASRSHALVIEPLAVPPDLALQGMTGAVAARQLQDELSAMDRDTDSARASMSYANNWADDIKVEIPETGLSLRDLERILRDKLGHDTHVSGEMVHTGEQLAISVRTGDADAVTVAGPASNVRALLQQAAAAVYERTQPYRYSILIQLRDHRKAEGRAIDEKLVAGGSPEDQLWALGNLGVTAENPRAGRMLLLRAIDIAPGRVLGWYDITNEDMALGRVEASLVEARKALPLLANETGRYIRPSAAVWIRAYLQILAADAVGDYPGELAALDSTRGQPDYSQGAEWTPLRRARVFIHMHEPGRARAILARDTSLTATADIMMQGGEYAAASPSAELGDWSGAVSELEPWLGDAMTAQTRAYLNAGYAPLLAEALAHLHRDADADRLLGTLEPDNYTGLRARGRIAAFRGDAAGADRWFAEALRQGPSLPFAETDWGSVLIARGRPDLAVAKLQAARDKGPRFADPVELLGEALLARRDWRGAADRFRDAAGLAPRWGRNRLMWAQALLKIGDTAGARRQLQLARGMDLTQQDRAAVEVLLTANTV